MDESITDEMLLEPFDMGDLTALDIEKFHKGLFSPSPKLIVHESSSPAKLESPPRLVPQMIPQSLVHRSPQRKPQLGPNFDRLGILHENADLPVVPGPYFAKALQQHGGTTLGALLQAHQQAMQQAYINHYQARENLFLRPQTNAAPVYLPTPPMNAYEQCMRDQMMPPIANHFSGDQIVPQAPQLVPASALQETPCIKRDGPTQRARLGACSDEHDSDQTTDDEDDLLFQEFLPGEPPKSSVLVCYQYDPRSRLPSFSDAFSSHISRLKMKEEHLREILVQHEEEQERRSILARERRDNPSAHFPALNGQPTNASNRTMSMEVDSLINKDFDKVDSGKKCEDRVNADALSNRLYGNPEPHKTDFEGRAATDESNDYPELEFLHETKVNDTLSYFDGARSAEADACPLSQRTELRRDRLSDGVFLCDGESAKSHQVDNKNLPLFEDDLVFSAHTSYDNLFNGHTDEHYFNAFKKNNVHLVPESCDHHSSSASDAEMFKYLANCPMDFLNESF